jgi:DNA-directed RNA polymerase specialized sigma24 family protein
LIWRWLYDPTIGYFNYIIGEIVNFLNSTLGFNLSDPNIQWLSAPPGRRLPIDELQLAFEERAGDLVALDAALAKLATFDTGMVEVVDLHFFAGLSFAEVARATRVPLRTVERRWAATRAWLSREIR